MDAHYSIINKQIEYSNGTVDGFVSYFRSRMRPPQENNRRSTGIR